MAGSGMAVCEPVMPALSRPDWSSSRTSPQRQGEETTVDPVVEGKEHGRVIEINRHPFYTDERRHDARDGRVEAPALSAGDADWHRERDVQGKRPANHLRRGNVETLCSGSDALKPGENERLDN